MSEKIRKLLDGKGGNYIFPFFWQHGESEEVLREYMKVIYESNIRAVCVESRPHPDYCGPKWWQDMDVILDEARKRDMKVWILDDSHFPTGFANGAMSSQPDELCRQSICCRIYDLKGKPRLEIEKEKLLHPDPFEKTEPERFLMPDKVRTFGDDKLLAVYAVRQDGAENGFGKVENRIDLIPCTEEDSLKWEVPEGDWKAYVLHLSRNFGPHRDYINMMSRASCRVLLDAVYEPHYAHYKEDFGKTIAGFFSDEPELGNGHLYKQDDAFGTMIDYPWSEELEKRLRSKWGEEFGALLPLLWETEADADLTAKVRYAYMDAVSQLVREDFSEQIGGWCRAHGVKYIGHLIEDNNHHSRTGSSLGHYFRGLAGQDMAGIDDIGGQVFPQGEDIRYDHGLFAHREGEFYHYLLGKLGSSAAAIEPRKNQDSMCEIFGAYGWEEGVRLEKYLADHFMVRGINHFVPHAFSPKEFPDPDCPPHFYAHGNNPQYRHFGKLMAYMNRVCELTSGGRHVAPVALLYHGEGDWTGKFMADDIPAHVLCDHQIEFDVIPQDVFAEPEEFRTRIEKGVLRVNTQAYRVVVVPFLQYVTAAFAKAVKELREQGVPVWFLEGMPEGICDTRTGAAEDAAMIEDLKKGAKVVKLEDLAMEVRAHGWQRITITPEDDRIRYYQYVHPDGSTVYLLVNEGTKTWKGEIAFLSETKSGTVYEYDAWENRVLAVTKIPEAKSGEKTEPIGKTESSEKTESVGKTVSGAAEQDRCETGEEPEKRKDIGITISAEIEPMHSRIYVFDAEKVSEAERQEMQKGKYLADRMRGNGCGREELPVKGKWKRSICRSIAYPAFSEAKEITLPDRLAEEEPEFSGFVRYENQFVYENGHEIGKKCGSGQQPEPERPLQEQSRNLVSLEITDAYEGVEVFVNGKSLGIQVVPTYRFDLSDALVCGTNTIVIEVATTLEREMAKIPNRFGQKSQPKCLSGITGEIHLYRTKIE